MYQSTPTHPSASSPILPTFIAFRPIRSPFALLPAMYLFAARIEHGRKFAFIHTKLRKMKQTKYLDSNYIKRICYIMPFIFEQIHFLWMLVLYSAKWMLCVVLTFVRNTLTPYKHTVEQQQRAKMELRLSVSIVRVAVCRIIRRS